MSIQLSSFLRTVDPGRIFALGYKDKICFRSQQSNTDVQQEVIVNWENRYQ
jgi:hypothetical protein